MPKLKTTRSERISRRFKAAQIEKGYTQEDVAKRLRVDQGTISHWYNHPDNISLGKLRLLCQVLGVSTQEIISIE